MGFRLASAFEDPIAFGLPFAHSRPLFSYLPTTIRAHLLPVNEFTLRLPYALIGALQMPLLLLLTIRAFGRRAVGFAGVMLLGTGLFAINRLTLGISVFIVFELAGALLMLRYAELKDRKWLISAAALLATSALTFFDGALLLAAALGFAWWTHRDKRDFGLSVLASAGVLVAFAALSMIAISIYSNGASFGNGLVQQDLFSQFVDRAGGIGLPDIGFFESWFVYVGVPVVLLLLIGLVEALIHSRSHRTALMLLLGLAAANAVPWLFLEPRMEHPAFAAPLVIAVAGFYWAQLMRQLKSVATQGMGAMAVAAVAMAGVVWQQAVFNRESEFTAGLKELRAYTLFLEHGRGLLDGDTSGIRAVAHMLREETEQANGVLCVMGFQKPL
jgi:4-amino-4-deoxy-L-arabinose transferase-like glycosyltransferase